jgi:hypothetical protein
MKTVFDLVGKFGCVKREKEGDPAKVEYKYITLHADMAPNQCTGGTQSLRVHAIRLAQPYIKDRGLERMWLEDWNLVERHVEERQVA